MCKLKTRRVFKYWVDQQIRAGIRRKKLKLTQTGNQETCSISASIRRGEASALKYW